MNKTEKYSLTAFQRMLKYGADWLIAFGAIIIFSPLMLVVWIAMKVENSGPVIYSQERIGFGGKPFVLYKFRSMRVDAEVNGTPQLYQNADDRLTPVGRFLRTYHLDELPQLWNVLRGDMSFVGYRPERLYFIEQIMKHNSDYQYLYLSRPGVFSYATLYNGYTFNMEKMLTRLDMDLKYLENYSIFSDLKIIFLSGCYILSGKKF